MMHRSLAMAVVLSLAGTAAASPHLVASDDAQRGAQGRTHRARPHRSRSHHGSRHHGADAAVPPPEAAPSPPGDPAQPPTMRPVPAPRDPRDPLIPLPF